MFFFRMIKQVPLRFADSVHDSGKCPALELATILANGRWECILFPYVSMTVMRPRATGGKRRKLETMEERGYSGGGCIGDAKTHDSSW